MDKAFFGTAARLSGKIGSFVDCRDGHGVNNGSVASYRSEVQCLPYRGQSGDVRGSCH